MGNLLFRLLKKHIFMSKHTTQSDRMKQKYALDFNLSPSLLFVFFVCDNLSVSDFAAAAKKYSEFPRVVHSFNFAGI